MKITVVPNTLGVIIKNNKVKCLAPGNHYTFNNPIILNDLYCLEEQGLDVTKLFNANELDLYTETIIVDDGCFMIRYVNNIRTGIFITGTYQFLLSDNNVRYDFYTKDNIELLGLSNDTIRALIRLNLVTTDTIYDQCKGVLYVDGVKKAILNPGTYVYNILNNKITIKNFDLSVLTLAPQNQELLTKDKIGLRINFWTNYKITNLDFIVNNYCANLDEVLRNYVQMGIRSFICDKTLDEVLQEKEKIGKAILTFLQEGEKQFGVTFLDAGIKDIILPGEIRDIMNTVLIAEKKAQANVITRREETASTRSLLNTAKLMEENAILYRLKELEMMERIFEKVGSITVSGSNVLENLESMLGNKKKN